MTTTKITSKESTRIVLKNFFSIYRQFPWSFFLCMVAPGIGSIAIFYVPPIIVGRLVDLAQTTGGLSIEQTISYLIWFALAWIGGEIFWRIGLHYNIKLVTKGFIILGPEALQKILEHDYAFFTNHQVGSITKKANAYPSRFEGFTGILSLDILPLIIPVIFASVVLYRYTPVLILIIFLFLIIGSLAIIPLIRKRAKLIEKRHEASSALSGLTSDIASNILAIKSSAEEDTELHKYAGAYEDFAKKWKKTADYHNLVIDTTITPFYALANTAGLVAAIYFHEQIGLPSSAILIIFSYYSSITRVFWYINHIYRQLEDTIIEAREFVELSMVKKIVLDQPNAKDLFIKKGEVEFKSVRFKHEGSTEDFFSDLNLKIQAGEKVGLVGPSGSGKSTITKLLLRFSDPESGQILIDGADLRQITQKSLRKNITYVPQEPMLFHRSIFENIAYGTPGASLKDVKKAAEAAKAAEFIDNLKDGYETLVGERGIKLSGGQRQRVTIARAILKKSKILILDEATSALDSESEKYIQENLVKIMKGRTSIVIAHRLSTIKHLDRIIVLDKGKIIEDGTHTTLIKKDGLYAKLWKHQSGNFI